MSFWNRLISLIAIFRNSFSRPFKFTITLTYRNWSEDVITNYIKQMKKKKLKGNAGSKKKLRNLVSIFQKLSGSFQMHRIIMLINIVTAYKVDHYYNNYYTSKRH